MYKNYYKLFTFQQYQFKKSYLKSLNKSIANSHILVKFIIYFNKILYFISIVLHVDNNLNISFYVLFN